MNQQLKFNRSINQLIVSADNLGVWIVAGWTIGIPKEKAISYVQSYDSSAAEGFFEHEGEVILSHGPGKIYLSKPEANAIVDMIRNTYM
ncbi:MULTISPECIES: hypothetical protein [Pseudomonas]|uniref:hypothetical protein n=1 Tax=Pseudomonas TaxID=286 RepID=UPI003524A206